VEAEVPALTPHGLRHTAASLLSEHAPIAVAREVLGHSSLAITNTYIHATDAAKRAGSDALAHLLTEQEASV
jgi:integrase